MSLETMTKLATSTVGVGGVASVTFSNIPQNYTDLKVVMSAKTSDANTGTIANIKFNSNTSSYSSRFLQGRGDINSSSTGSTSAGDVGRIPGVNSPVTDNIYSNTEISILNYSSNTYKAYSSDAISEASQTIAYATMTAGLWSNPETITSITFTPSAGSFAQYSTFTIYGMKNAQKTAGNSIKATGGNIIFDGTYVYHVFPTTGAFVSSQSLLTDLLVVGGGAGGGGGRAGNHYGGGGGAGAAFTLASQYLTLGSYAVTVGAGGAGGSNSISFSQGTNGSSSQFGALTAATGGGGGGSGNTVGLAGASGGGGGGWINTSPAGGAGNQGFAGGAGAAAYRGGGGGGAGAVGADGSTSAGNGGVGGIGLTSALVSALCSATGIGQNVSGTWYVAGGGSGTPEPTLGGSGGGGGGGLGASGSAGTVSSGGGGGGGTAGAESVATGGTGGSGVVIIRYKG